MIISKGHLIASDTAENLTAMLAGTTTLRLEAAANESSVRAVLDHVDGIEDLHMMQSSGDATTVELKPEENTDIRARVFHAFAKSDIALLEMTSVRASLEDVFLELTQQEPLQEAAPQDQQESDDKRKEDA